MGFCPLFGWMDEWMIEATSMNSRRQSLEYSKNKELRTCTDTYTLHNNTNMVTDIRILCRAAGDHVP